ncbi:MAG: DUF3592 domain-containing protein [Chitinophagaceae bacterium]|nr:DUF3592 domain-containing protein [Chitinophagaceae bacterium]
METPCKRRLRFNICYYFAFMSEAYNIIVCIVLIIVNYRFVFTNNIKELKEANFLRKKGVKTSGRIIDIYESKDSDGLKIFTPIIEYTTEEGKTLHFKPNDSRMNKPIINNMVEVRYDKDNPGTAIIDRKSTYNFIIFKLVISCLAFCFLFFVLFRYIR